MRASTEHVRIVPRTRIASVVSLCALAAALAGCGGSSSTPSTRSASHSTTVTAETARPTPAQSNPDVGGATVQHSHAAGTGGTRAAHGSAPALNTDRTAVHTGPVRVQKARPTPQTTSDEKSTSAATQPNPCQLVSLPQAQTITGGAVTSRIEAPLGPTCIYKRSGSGPGITLAIESMSFAQATRHMEKRQAIVIHSRQAYCGHLGSQLLVVRLGRTQLLNVTAPCGIAQRFAALALSRLTA